MPPSSGAGRSGAATYISLFVGGIIVGILISWGWSATHTGGTGTNTASSSVETSTTTGNTQSGNSQAPATAGMPDDELLVPSPQAAGQSVVITQAAVSSPTWVVVYEDKNGAPGNVLGAQLFYTTGPGIVTLLRATEPGQTYYVGRSVDNGNHKYTLSQDKPTLNADGSIQTVSFTAN